jgi:hypothetical protein
VATSRHSLVADYYLDRSGNKQEKIMGPMWGALFYLIFTTDQLQLLGSWAPGLLGSWAPDLQVCRRKLRMKVTCKSYIEKLHAKVT